MKGVSAARRVTVCQCYLKMIQQMEKPRVKKITAKKAHE